MNGGVPGDAVQSLVVAQFAAELYDHADEQRSEHHKRPPDGKE